MQYKSFIYLLLLIMLPAIAFADGAQELFKKANQQYARGQYPDAVKSYQQLINSGYQSIALYFNMGNASYKNGDLGPALLYYEKAHKLSPGDEDINFNIRLVNLKTSDRIEEAPEFFLAKWWRGFILMIAGGTLAVLSIILVLLASAALIIYLFTQSVGIKKTSFYGAIILFALGLITVFMSARQASYFDNHRQAIIFNTVTVRSAPGNTGKTLFVLHEGTKVDVLENNSNTIKIKLANGNEGWISAADAKNI